MGQVVSGTSSNGGVKMMDEREQLQDLENHRHEDEFSPNFDPSDSFVETNDGDVDTLSPTDKLLTLLDDSISLKERLERTEDK